MSMIALSIFAAAAVSTGGQSLVCQQPAQGREATKAFRLAFSVKGGKLGKIVLDDPQAVLDPLADVPVLTPASRSGPLVLNKSAPPPRKPMKLSGRVLTDDSFEFVNKVPALQLLLVSVAGSPDSFTYSFQGNRLLSGVMRMGYDGKGSCVTAAATSGASER
jgi:hypothetical protein